MKHVLKTLLLLGLLLGASAAPAQQSFVIDVVTEGAGISPPVSELLIEDPFPMFSLLDLHMLERYDRDYFGMWDRAEGYLLSVHSNTVATMSRSYSAWQFPAYLFYKDWVFGLTLPLVEGRRFSYRGDRQGASGFGDIAMTLGYSYPLPVDISYAAAMTIKFPTANSGAYRSRLNTPLGTGAPDLIFSINLQHTMTFGDVQVLGQWRGNGDRTYELIAHDPNDPTHIVETEYDVRNGNALLVKALYNHRFIGLNFFDYVDLDFDAYSGLHLKHLYAAGYTEWTKHDNQTGGFSSSFPGHPSLTTLEWFIGANYFYAPFTGRAQLVLPLGVNHGGRTAENYRDVEFRLGLTWFWAMDMSPRQLRNHQLRERIKERQYRERSRR